MFIYARHLSKANQLARRVGKVASVLKISVMFIYARHLSKANQLVRRVGKVASVLKISVIIIFVGDASSFLIPNCFLSADGRDDVNIIRIVGLREGGGAVTVVELNAYLRRRQNLQHVKDVFGVE